MGVRRQVGSCYIKGVMTSLPGRILHPGLLLRVQVSAFFRCHRAPSGPGGAIRLLGMHMGFRSDRPMPAVLHGDWQSRPAGNAVWFFGLDRDRRVTGVQEGLEVPTDSALGPVC